MLLEKLLGAHLEMNSPDFIEFQDSLPCLQQKANGRCLKSDE
jgi:hypothetical protein